MRRGKELCARVERLQDGLDLTRLDRSHQIQLVEHDHVGEFDLIDQEIGHRSFVVLAERFAAVCERVGGFVVAQEARRVDHRHHRVQTRDLAEAHAVLVLEGERLRDGDRLRYARGLDQQIVEPILLSESRDLLEQIVPQRAADTPVGHFDQLLVGS